VLFDEKVELFQANKCDLSNLKKNLHFCCLLQPYVLNSFPDSKCKKMQFLKYLYSIYLSCVLTIFFEMQFLIPLI